MATRYTREALLDLPMFQIENLDIRDKEEEDLIQEVIDEKRAVMPKIDNLVISTSSTDNMTPEKEAELQAQINEKRGIRADLDEVVEDEETVPDLLTEEEVAEEVVDET